LQRRGRRALEVGVVGERAILPTHTLGPAGREVAGEERGGVRGERGVPDNTGDGCRCRSIAWQAGLGRGRTEWRARRGSHPELILLTGE
jgi:hypothetical protein